MIYSFSRLSSWDNCKLSWKYNYLLELEGLNNGWSDAGTLIHSILEDYDEGKYTLEELPAAWWDRYDKEVVSEFPDSFVDLHEHYKNKVFKFLFNFKGFSTKSIATELEFIYYLPDGNQFKGFIDSVREDSEGNIIVVDYKISKKFTKKKLKEKEKQLLLYAPAIKEKYGKYPNKAYFMFVQTGEVVEVKITEKAVMEALKWATDTIKSIESATEHPSIIDLGEMDSMFCESICGFRNICESKTK